MNTDGSCDTRNSTTATSHQSVHEFRDTLRSVALPTAVTPFGPMRKREKPPVIPGQRKPVDSIRPRRPFPAPPIVRIPLSRDIEFNQGAYDEAFDAFQRPDRYDRPAAWDACGEDDGPAIPRIPGQRQASDYGSAA